MLRVQRYSNKTGANILIDNFVNDTEVVTYQKEQEVKKIERKIITNEGKVNKEKVKSMDFKGPDGK